MEKNEPKNKTGWHLILVIVIVSSALGMSYLFYDYGAYRADNILTRGLKYSSLQPYIAKKRFLDSIKSIDYSQTIFIKNINAGNDDDGKPLWIKHFFIELPPTKNCQIERIHQQISETAFRAWNSLLTAKEFMVQSYLCLSEGAIFFIIAACALAFISKDGISKTDSLVITLFLCSLSIGIFFSGLTKVFDLDDNAKGNIKLYVDYINLENKMRSNLVNNEKYFEYLDQACPNKNDTSIFSKMIRANDKEMRNLNKIDLGFDYQSLEDFENAKIGVNKND